jgi:hypothetical protein
MEAVETNKSYLIATFDLPPYKPVAQPFTTTADCYAQCSYPALVRSTVPTLWFNAQSPFGGDLMTAVEIRNAPSDTATIVVANSSFRTTVSATPVTVAGTSPAVLAHLQVPAGALSNGNTYYWRGTTSNENSLWSGWSSWYAFTVDTSPPAVASVSSSQYPLKDWGAQVGTPGTFTYSGPSDVYDYTWWVDGDPAGAATTTATSVSHPPATDMVHTFHVKARDKAGNTGGNYDYQFWVKPLANRCWHWKLDESSGTNAADSGNTDVNDPVCAPIGTSVTAMPGSLSGGVSFGTGYMGNAAIFTGSGGQITTGSAIVDTTKSFTVAAWVKPSSLAADATIISQDGTNTSGFQLNFDKDANSGAGGWCFTVRTSDSATATPTTACADGQVLGMPTVDVWFHVAGIYDATTQTVTVHVSGGSESCSGETTSAVQPSPYRAGLPARRSCTWTRPPVS